MQGTWDMVLFPGLGRSPGGGHGNPLQYPCLKNLMDRRASQATVHGVPQSQTPLKWLRTQHSTFLTSTPCLWLLVYHAMRRQSLDLVTFPEQSYYQKYLERYGLGMVERTWQNLEVQVHFASRHLCLAQRRVAFLSLYELPPSSLKSQPLLTTSSFHLYVKMVFWGEGLLHFGE